MIKAELHIVRSLSAPGRLGYQLSRLENAVTLPKNSDEPHSVRVGDIVSEETINYWVDDLDDVAVVITIA